MDSINETAGRRAEGDGRGSKPHSGRRAGKTKSEGRTTTQQFGRGRNSINSLIRSNQSITQAMHRFIWFCY
jgi:hypothetical protein